MMHVTTPRNPGKILSEISHTQKGKCYMIHSHETFRIGKFIDMESRLEVTRGCG